MVKTNSLEHYRLQNQIIKYDYVISSEPLNFDEIMATKSFQTYQDATYIHESELFEDFDLSLTIEGYKSDFHDRIDTPELRNSYLWESSGHFYEISLFKNKNLDKV